MTIDTAFHDIKLFEKAMQAFEGNITKQMCVLHKVLDNTPSQDSLVRVALNRCDALAKENYKGEEWLESLLLSNMHTQYSKKPGSENELEQKYPVHAEAFQEAKRATVRVFLAIVVEHEDPWAVAQSLAMKLQIIKF